MLRLEHFLNNNILPKRTINNDLIIYKSKINSYIKTSLSIIHINLYKIVLYRRILCFARKSVCFLIFKKHLFISIYQLIGLYRITIILILSHNIIYPWSTIGSG